MSTNEIKRLNMLSLGYKAKAVLHSDRHYIAVSPLYSLPQPTDCLRIDAFLLCFCLNGTLSLYLDSHEVKLESGGCVLISPNSLIHSVIADGNCQITLIGYSIDAVSKLLSGSNKIWEMMSKLMISAKAIITYDMRYLNLRIQSFVSILRYRTKENDIYRDELFSHLFATLFFDVLNDIHLPACNTPGGNRRTATIYKEFLTLLCNDTAKHRNVKYFADKLCITPKYLSKIVKEFTSRPAVNVIIDYSMSRLYSELRFSEEPMKAIAHRYNFESYAAFCKFFKTHAGCNPLTYRNREIQK